MSTAQRVFAWISEHPYVMYGLRKRLINYSSLCRLIQKELGIKNFDAVLAAVRRHAEKPTVLASTGKEIMDVLRKSFLEVRTGITVTITKTRPRDHQFLHLISSGTFSVVISDKELDIDAIKTHTGVVEVRVKSPPELEKVPGVVAYLYNAVAEAGINIIETYSCYSDTIFIVSKKDFTALVALFDRMGIR